MALPGRSRLRVANAQGSSGQGLNTESLPDRAEPARVRVRPGHTRSSPTSNEFSCTAQGQAEGKLLPRWRKRRLRRERYILHALNLLASFSAHVCGPGLSERPAAHTKCDVKRHGRTYIDACISMSFLAVPAKAPSRIPRGEITTEPLAFRYNPSRRQSRTAGYAADCRGTFEKWPRELRSTFCG